MKDYIIDAVAWLVSDTHSSRTIVGPAVTSAFFLSDVADQFRESVGIAANHAVVSIHDLYAKRRVRATLRRAFRRRSVDSGFVRRYRPVRLVCGLRGRLWPLQGDTFGWLHRSARYGEEWAIMENYFKPCSSCRYMHQLLDSLRKADNGPDVDPDASRCISDHTFPQHDQYGSHHPDHHNRCEVHHSIRPCTDSPRRYCQSVSLHR